jgi:hypothetical protein
MDVQFLELEDSKRDIGILGERLESCFPSSELFAGTTTT